MHGSLLAALVAAAVAAAGICLAAETGGMAAPSRIRTQAVEYKEGNTVLEGYLACDETDTNRRPLVLVVHEWWGLNDYARGRARQLAEMGYVAFAVDMYGKGVVTKDPAEAGKLAGALKGNIPLLRGRILAALETAKKDPRVDANRVAAIGYCFGGTTVLELARSGAAISGVVSFHGGLDSADPNDARHIQCKVLVETGADDRSVPPTRIAAFMDEMRLGKVDYHITIHGGAVHTFTNPASGNNTASNSAYNEAADRRSWQEMKDFFAELFPPPKK